MDLSIVITALSYVGIFICVYAMDIESGKKKYKRVCDVNESMSCTLVLTSKYGHMAKLLFNLNEKSFFNRSNAEYGLWFYIAMAFFQVYPFTMLPYHDLLFFFATLSSMIVSICLAGILYFILHNFCMICVCMYFLNTLLFLSAIIKLRM